MGLSKIYLDYNEQSLVIDLLRLGDAFYKVCPEIVFCLVIGSSAKGVVPAHSDLDIAVFLNQTSSWELHREISKIVHHICGDVRCDLGILNNTEPVYRYEALKGRLLFTRDEETWLNFYSLTSREYESQIADYERQLKYRLEAVE